MVERFARVLAHLVARVTVNEVAREGARWVKRRKPLAPALVAPGNVYLRIARAGFRMHASTRAWAAYEVSRHRALHGAATAGFVRHDAIWTAHVEGTPLTALLARGAGAPAEEDALRAAGVELRRAHRVVIEGVAFSHGDLHLSNLIFDRASSRARVLDFETPHDVALTAEARQADDVQALLLDLVGKTGPCRAETLGRAFVDGYRDGTPAADAVLAATAPRLAVARRLFPRSLQLVRTRALDAATLEGALQRLRPALASGNLVACAQSSSPPAS